MNFLRYFVFNLLGSGLPIVAALVAVPAIVHFGGVDRLGQLGVVWGIIGYLNFLDFGLSRIVTRRVALAKEFDRLDEELTELRGFLWWRATPSLLVFTLLLIVIEPLLANYLPDKLAGPEMQNCWLWLALCLPSTLMSNWLRGALEGVERFARANLLRTVLGIWSTAAPALVALVSPRLDAMVALIALGRLLSFAAHVWACYRVEPAILVGHAPRRLKNLPLFFREGGWMTISNIAAPMMVYADRFILAALFAGNVVAWYVTSLDMMMRMLMIPSALAGALFPKFSSASEPALHAKAFVDYQRSIRILAAIMLPLCTLAAFLAYDGLRLWLGESFAIHAHRVVEITAAGIFMNGIALLGLTWLQGSGRSNLAARIHIAQLLVYIVCLFFAVKWYGIDGAAWIWMARAGVDCLLMVMTANMQGRRAAFAIIMGGAAFILLAGNLTSPDAQWQTRVGLAGAGALVSLLTAWLALLNRADRSEIGRLRHAN